MATKPKRPSPILGAATAMIGEASDSLVTSASRFRHTFELAVDKVRPDAGQPRRRFDEEEIAGLAATMAEQGQLQPILVRRDPEQRGQWIIVAGERRWRAAQRNGWPALLAIEHGDDPEVAALIENLQRVDLTPVEEARGLKRLIEGKGWSQNEAARVLGKSKGEISATLRILTLPDPVLETVLTSEPDIPRNVLVELARVEDPATRARLLALAGEGGLTVRAIRQAVGGGEEPRTVSVAAHARGAKGAPAALGAKAVDRMIAALAAMRASGNGLEPEERRRLERLRAEIDATLEG